MAKIIGKLQLEKLEDIIKLKQEIDTIHSNGKVVSFLKKK